ncbi:MAG: pilus assembly protein TadG-related protein, partial [Xanthobacteraceae bacterium]
MITALAMLPMVAAVGCAIDYTSASMIKTKLQAAADAASLASVSLNSSVIATAKAMSGNGTVSGGSTFATNFFNANLTSAPETTGYTNLTPTATVTRTSTTVTAVVSFTAQVPTYFMGLVGFKNIALSGTSSASYTLPTYIDFYLMLDVSGSMSFPSTAAEQERLEAVNPDNYSQYPNGCTFACHFTSSGVCGSGEEPNIPPTSPINYAKIYNPSPGGYCQGFTITRLGTTPAACTSSTNCSNIKPSDINWSNTLATSCPTDGTSSCIQLRADAVGYAVSDLLLYASQHEVVTNQFRVGLYPFIRYLYSYFPLTTDLTDTGSGTVTYASTQLATLLDTGVNANLGSGGTHFENAFPSMNGLISSVGTGVSSSSTLPYV